MTKKKKFTFHIEATDYSGYDDEYDMGIKATSVKEARNIAITTAVDNAEEFNARVDVGLGTGKGQKYRKKGSEWVKVGG